VPSVEHRCHTPVTDCVDSPGSKTL
jgi:hypothetical protein